MDPKIPDNPCIPMQSGPDYPIIVFILFTSFSKPSGPPRSLPLSLSTAVGPLREVVLVARIGRRKVPPAAPISPRSSGCGEVYFLGERPSGDRELVGGPFRFPVVQGSTRRLANRSSCD